MKKIYLILTCLLGLHLLILLNLRFTAWPEMVSYPYFFNNGFKLYTDFVHPYPPLLTVLLAIIYRLFGYKLLALKLFTWTIIFLSDLLIFLIAKKLTHKNTFALVSLFFYIVTQPFLDGNQLWFDLAIVPPVLCGVLLFQNKKYFWAGVLLALAALVKQTAGLFIILTSLFIIIKEKNIKNFASFVAGPAILGIALALYLAANNSFLDFLNWNLFYPFGFWSKFPGYVQMNLERWQILILGSLIIPLIPMVNKMKKYSMFLLFFAVSLVLIYPRFSFFHFQLAVAFMAILYGVALAEIKKPAYYLLAIIPIAVIFFKGQYTFAKSARFWDQSELDLAEQIKTKAEKNNSLYLFGLSSNLYVFSESLPPKPWADNFGWYWEIPGFQEKTLESWDTNKPFSIIWNDPAQGNWFDLGVYQPQKITSWVVLNYNKVEEIRPGVWFWQLK